MGDKISTVQYDSNNENPNTTIKEPPTQKTDNETNPSSNSNNQTQPQQSTLDQVINRHQKCRSSGNLHEYSSDSSTKEQSDSSLSDHENTKRNPLLTDTNVSDEDDDDEDNDNTYNTTNESNSHIINTNPIKPRSPPFTSLPNIDIDIKRIFGAIRPVHEDYSQEEIDKSCSTYSTVQNNTYELNFCRNGEQVRHTYIAKLITKKVWVPSQKEKTHNSLIIFDWDDTLLCTSFLATNGVFNENLELTATDREKVKKLEFASLNLLKKAIAKGDVYIITNAGPGWVEYSAEKFYPSLKTVLKQITIISARGENEAESPGDPRKWKKRTFLNLHKKMNTKLVTNIICLGDSSFEMEAGKVLAKKFQQAFVKTVKFRENPKPEELHSQLVLVANQFNSIYAAVKSLTIRVEKKKGNASNAKHITNCKSNIGNINSNSGNGE